MLESLMLAQLGVVLKEVVGPLAKAAAEDWCKDRLKQGLDEAVFFNAPDAAKKAVRQSLRNFIKLFGDELENCGLPSELVKHDEFAKPLGRLLATEDVRRELCRAFETGVEGLDWQLLPDTWNALTPPSTFPEAFEWEDVSEKYVRRVKGLIRQDKELARQLELDQQRAIKESNEALVGVPVQFNLREYQESLKEKFGSLSLDSLDTTGAAYDGLRLWKIFVAQDVRECAEFAPQMYELPKERLLELQAAGEIDPLLSLDALEQRRRSYAEKPVESVRGVVGLDGADAVLRSVILGDPGSGKSTLLRSLALGWAEKSLAKLKGESIPLLIELRLYAQDKDKGICNDFLEYLHRGNTACRLNQLELDELLKGGKAVALFDGVDEVFDPVLREAVVTDIHRFSNRYPAVQMVVTSRWLGYKAEALRKAEFAHYMLQDLNDEQIENFLERWHRLTFGQGQQEEKERKQGRLQKAIVESKAIRELAGNPLLLTMMAILNRNQELPRDRARLYEEASKVLLYQWDVEGKLYEQEDLKHWQIDVRDKQAMLRKVAHHMQANEKGLSGNVISRNDLEDILTGYLKNQDVDRARPVARVVIEQLRERNFILCYLGANNYAFVHRTFLEYFCASEFVHQFEKERKLDKKGLKALYGEHFSDESWDEVLRLIAGMVESRFVGEIIEHLLNQSIPSTDRPDNSFLRLNEGEVGCLLLSVDCLAEVRNRKDIERTSNLLLNRLKQLMEFEQSHLLPFGAERYLLPSIAHHWKNDVKTLPFIKTHAQKNSDKDIRTIAIQEIARGWKNDPETLPWLKAYAQENDNWHTCSAAIQEIARGWKNDPEILLWLKKRVQEGNQSALVAAMREVARGWKNDPEILLWLKTYAIEEDRGDIRIVAMQEIAKGWKSDPDILPWLKKCTQEEDRGDIRIVAMQEIAKGWKSDPDILPWLKERTQEDGDWNVRRTAIQELVKGWKNDLGMLSILKGCAQEDHNADVRWTAIQELVKGWKNNPGMFSILKKHAQEDDDRDIRRTAMQELARGWKHDPRLFYFWCDCSLNDPFKRENRFQNNLRQIALQVLTHQYPKHPKTKELLQDRAKNDTDEILRDWATRQLNCLAYAEE